MKTIGQDLGEKRKLYGWSEGNAHYVSAVPHGKKFVSQGKEYRPKVMFHSRDVANAHAEKRNSVIVWK